MLGCYAVSQWLLGCYAFVRVFWMVSRVFLCGCKSILGYFYFHSHFYAVTCVVIGM